MLFAKVDAMTHRLDRSNVDVVNSSAPPPCAICDLVEPVTINYQVGSPFTQDTSEEVNYVNITQDRPMTLIPIATIRVGGITQISYIGLTFPTCPK